MKYKFNNKYLKDNSKPGSWRRGYEYFKKGQVEEITLKDSTVTGKIKGNYKSYYETSIKFNKTSAKPSCSCPLEEPWCKHAVALGLTALKDHLWDEFLYEKHDITPVF